MTPEARAARERKQKIFVVVGGLFLLAMMAFQLPKLLGGSSSPAAAPATTESAAVPQASAPATAAPVALPTGSRSFASAGKIASFTRFRAKDPFLQQVATQDALGLAVDGGDGKATENGGEAAKSPAQMFSTGGTAATAMTIVTVNGSRQVLEPGTKFPAADPLFVLVAEKPDSRSVVVGIVGGAYSGGAKTTTLKVGKPLTLVNTTTGARYKLALVSVGSGDAPAETTVTP